MAPLPTPAKNNCSAVAPALPALISSQGLARPKRTNRSHIIREIEPAIRPIDKHDIAFGETGMMLGRERKDAAGALIVANVLEGFANLFTVGAAIREGYFGQIDSVISLRHELVGGAVEAT